MTHARVTRAQLSTQDINNLPDSDFAYIEPGGSKDSSGKTVPRSLRHFPIHDAAHVRDALSRAPDSPFGDKALPKIHAAAKKFGIDVGGDSDDAMSRWTGSGMFVRSFPLQDIAIRSGGDGRTVEAYAAVFDIPAEIKDGQGHYQEVIDRAAFNRTIANNATRVGVFYNHGMNLYGSPSDRFSIPIGTPEQIKADGRGLLTVTRYNNTPQADEVLEAIRSGGIAGYSFTGRLIRSDPARPPRGGFARGLDGSLRTVRRHELGLAEYGPTPMPAYNEAAIVGVRAALREELRAMLLSTPDEDPDDSYDTPDDSGLVADDPRTHSVRLSTKELIQARRAEFLQKHRE